MAMINKSLKDLKNIRQDKAQKGILICV